MWGWLLVLAMGCGDVEFNWGTQPIKPRPAGPPAGRTVGESPPAGQGGDGATAKASPPHAQAPAAPRSVSPGQPSHTRLQLYQLVLLSQPGPAKGPPRLRHVRLKNARARDVARVLDILYLPSGPSGTDHRYTLVYPTALELDLAGDAAVQLDVAAAGEQPPSSEPGTLWSWGLAQAFQILDDPAVPGERVRRAVDSLRVAASSNTLGRLQRWAACMVAGELLAHRLYDYAAADAVYEEAERHAEPGSYEQMASLYGRSRGLLQDGRRDRARKVLETVLSQFSAFRGSEVFERARETLGEWQARER